MKKYFIQLIITLSLTVMMLSCTKEAGEGGTSLIFGTVYIRDYDDTFTILQDEYYGQDVEVFIIYGDDKTYSDRITTNYDGTYEFKYLRQGVYHIFAYSKDSTLQTLADIPIIIDVEITKNGTETEAPQIVILD